MEGLELNPEILIQTQQNLIAQNAVHIAQLEAAVQQLGAENAALRAQIPVEGEVKEDADTGTDG